MKINPTKIRSLIKWALGFQLFFSLNLVLFTLFSNPLIIGSGKFDNIVGLVETIDYKWWLLGLSLIYFIFAIAVFITFTAISISNFHLEELRESVYKALRGKDIPVRVDLDDNVQVEIAEPLKAEFSVSTHLNFKEKVHVKADIPLKLELPIDTIVEASVMGLGKIKIPIKTMIPIDLHFPFEGKVSVDVENYKLELSEEATVKLPAITVPIKAQLDANLNLESNLQRIENAITNKT